jgi:signal transduction histidine kinase
VVIHADADRMAQVLTNAAKYSEAGSPIVVTGGRDGAVVRLSVKNDGLGISPEMLETVVDAFVQHRQTLDPCERSRQPLNFAAHLLPSVHEIDVIKVGHLGSTL